MPVKRSIWWLPFAILLMLFLKPATAATRSPLPIKDLSAESRECIKCHRKQSPAVVQECGRSKHHGASVGCYECHQADARDPDAFIHNPDGTQGACSACHSRHAFSVEPARNPENCCKCHMGPDHPQIEIYEEFKARYAR